MKKFIMKHLAKSLLYSLICCVVITHLAGVGKKSQPLRDQSLVTYLETLFIPKEVLTLAMVGVMKYKNQDFALKKKRGTALIPEPAGGRLNRPWVKETFDREENSIENKLRELTPPSTWTIKDIDTAYLQVIKIYKRVASDVDFTLVKGLSVTYLNELPLGKNCIVQLASQFNYLESPGLNRVPVSDYPSDLTQGPQGSIEAAAAALYRTASVKVNKLQHALIDVLPVEHESYYKNGYLELKKYIGDVNRLKNYIQKNVAKMRILPQWVICEASGAKQLQVFASAPSFQGYDTPSLCSAEGEICNNLVTVQYEALGKIAVIHSIKNPKESLNIHLTLVGQGVFNNPSGVMANSFKKVAAIVKGYPNIHVYIHGYSSASQNLVTSLCREVGIDCKQMTVAEFVNKQV